jgi:hypothetical protein
MSKLVRVIMDPSVNPGLFLIGGTRVLGLDDMSDERIGRELRTVQVRCHGKDDAAHLRSIVESTDGLELA